MTTGDLQRDTELIALPSRQEMMLVQSVLDSLAETHASALSEVEHERLMEIMGDVQHHLRRCVRYDRDDSPHTSASIEFKSKDLPLLEKAQAEVTALEQQVMAKAARVRELNDQIPSMIDSIAEDINAATAGCVDLPGENCGGEVDSAAIQSSELAKLKSALPELQQRMVEYRTRVQSHVEVLHQKRGQGARRERSLLPDTATAKAI